MNDTPTTAEWVLRAMIAMAAADGNIEEREIELIQQTYQELTAMPLAREKIEKAAEANMKAADLVAEFEDVSPKLSIPTKEEIIRGAYLVLLADDNIAGEERKRLKDIAAALGISEIQFGAILEELSMTLATRNAT